MQKKTFLLALLPILIFSGCDTADHSKRSGFENIENSASENSDLIRVGYAQIGSESDWRIANTESIKNEFTKENGYFLLFEDGQQKQENQLKAVRNFILQEVDYIILDPVVENGWESVLEEAKSAGIPVILTDRFINVENEDLYTCWVGSNFYEEGRLAGEWLEAYLEKKNAAKETVRMVTLQGTMGSSAQLGRTAGFAEVLNTHENWEMLAMESADFTLAKGQEVMKDLLETYEDIDIVVCENDNMAFGAIQTLEQAGKHPGEEGDIQILSFDAVKTALELVAEGKITADFECNPLLGPEISDIIKMLENGEKVEKIRYINESYFDKEMDLSAILPERTY